MRIDRGGRLALLRSKKSPVRLSAPGEFTESLKNAEYLLTSLLRKNAPGHMTEPGVIYGDVETFISLEPCDRGGAPW